MYSLFFRVVIILIGVLVATILCRTVLKIKNKTDEDDEEAPLLYCEDPNIWREDLEDPEG